MHTYIFFRLDTIKDGGEVEANAHCCVGWDVMTVCCSLHIPERNTKTILQSIFWSSSVRWCIYTVTDGHILGLGGACAAMQPWIRKKKKSSFCFSGPAQSGHATERREPLRLEFPTNYSPSHSCKESCVSYFDTWSNIHMNWGQKEHILYMHAKRERLRCVCGHFLPSIPCRLSQPSGRQCVLTWARVSMKPGHKLLEVNICLMINVVWLTMKINFRN